MNHLSFNIQIDTILLMVIFNVVLTSLHYGLFLLYQKKKWAWSNRALNVVNFLMSMLSWAMANKRHPDDLPEVKK